MGRMQIARKKSIPNIAFMMEFTRKFIDEESSRLDFVLDFNYHVIQRYDKMYRVQRKPGSCRSYRA